MTELAGSSCVPCRGGVPPLTDAEIQPLLAEIPEWRVVVHDEIPRLERTFTFKDFAEAMRFAVAVGEIAEQEEHHPDLHVAWGKVRVETWTHKIRGLHRNDFVLAAKTDRLFATSGAA
jgi:4a-hydroxytetrahydrobiopterin dehydratase